VDILGDRLCSTDLHSGKLNDEWVLAEGLAIYLRSGVLYQKFNPGIADSAGVDDRKKLKKNEVPLTRWIAGRLTKASPSTILRLHPGSSILANAIKVQLGNKEEISALRGGCLVSHSVGRVKVTMDLPPKSKNRHMIKQINSLPRDGNLRRLLSSLKLWKVEILLEDSEDDSLSNGYGRYLAIDQLTRDLEHSL
jgi:hypothetical protein